MSRPFESTSVLKDTDDKATLRVNHKKFKKSDEASAELKNGNLRIEATIDGKLHGKVIHDVDIEPATKIEKKDGYFEVKMMKKSQFKLAAKMG